MPSVPRMNLDEGFHLSTSSMYISDDGGTQDGACVGREFPHILSTSSYRWRKGATVVPSFFSGRLLGGGREHQGFGATTPIGVRHGKEEGGEEKDR